MPRYIFDVHDDGPAEWGDEGLEVASRDEIEHQVRQLIEDAQARQTKRGSKKTTTIVYVHREGGGIILAAYGRPGDDVRLVWTPG